MEEQEKEKREEREEREELGGRGREAFLFLSERGMIYSLEGEKGEGRRQVA